jgi:alkanesulfonate monooxygenase SsuD/methylene tetrahydromethanopterin reductase-like flavin-dependent oxidoreductase (luciferase family)
VSVAGAGSTIRVGFQVWGQFVSWPELMAEAREIERLGFASLWSNDHFQPATGDRARSPEGLEGPFFEAWMTLAGFAAVTTHIPLGVLVSGAGYRNPALLVKQATALDHLSGGRVTLGLGAGWHEREHRAFGFEYPALGERIDRFEEQATVIRRLLDGESVTFAGRWARLEGARNDPPPLQAHLPLLIGASGERRTLRIVARCADAWDGEGDPATYARKYAVLVERCAEIGRDPATIRRTVGVPPACIRDTRPAAVAVLAATLERNGLEPDEARAFAEASPLAGDEATVLAALSAWHEAGAEEAIVDWPAPYDHETLERLAAALRLEGGPDAAHFHVK